MHSPQRVDKCQHHYKSTLPFVVLSTSFKKKLLLFKEAAFYNMRIVFLWTLIEIVVNIMFSRFAGPWPRHQRRCSALQHRWPRQRDLPVPELHAGRPAGMVRQRWKSRRRSPQDISRRNRQENGPQNIQARAHIQSKIIQLKIRKNRLATGLKNSRLDSKLNILSCQVRHNHFVNKGDLKLKCTATIFTVYWKSSEESVQGSGFNAHTAPVSESRGRTSGK